MQFWPWPRESWPLPRPWPRPRPLLASLTSLVASEGSEGGDDF